MISLSSLKSWYRGHRRAAWSLLAVAIAATAVVAWVVGRRSGIEYFTATVDRGDIVATVQATGTIGAVTTVQVGSQVSGQIAALKVDFNSQVKKGQLIAEIDPAPFQARGLQAEADLASAQAGVKSLEADVMASRANLEKVQAALREADLNRNRTLELFEQGIASQQQRDTVEVAYETAQANLRTAQAQINQTQARLEQARAQVKQSQARLEQSRLDLRNTFIRAPIDGTVIARNVDVGQTVAASLQAPTLFTIAQDLTQMLVYAKTDESDVGRIRVGVEATFQVDSFPQESFRGRVKQVRMNAYQVQNVVTYDTIVEFENPQLKLLPGMTAYVTIPVASARDVIKIPNGALRFKPQLSDQDRRALLARYGLLSSPERPEGGPGTVQAQEQTASGNSSGARPERSEARSRWQGRSEGGAAASGTQGLPRSEAGVEGAYQIVWKLLPNNTLQPVRVKTGVTDFTFTAVLEGDLHQGDKLVIGQTLSEGAARSPLQGGGSMMRRF